MGLLRQDVLWCISHLSSKDALGRHVYEKNGEFLAIGMVESLALAANWIE